MSQGTKIVAVVLFVLFLGTGVYYLTVSPTPPEPPAPAIESPRPVVVAPPPEPAPITNNPVSVRGGGAPDLGGTRAADPLATPSRIARTPSGAPAVVMPPLAVPRGGSATGVPVAPAAGPGAAPPPNAVVTNPPSAVRPVTPVAPVPATPTPAAASTAAREHVVAAGETLSAIAARHLGAASRWREIARANPSVNPDNLRVGTKLVLPESGQTASSAPTSPAPSAGDPGIYVVRSGDTLAAIARRTLGNADWATLYAANRDVIGPDPAALRVGMKLSIPKRS